MSLTVALIGAGRMGAFIFGQLPAEYHKIVIDIDEDKAARLAAWSTAPGTASVTHAASLDSARGADIAIIALPGPQAGPMAAKLGPLLPCGAVILNMATEGVIDAATRRAYPHVSFLDAKIIGHAGSMAAGAPGCVVIGTQDEAAFQLAAKCLPGFWRVDMGDASLVPVINKIASTEGIRAAVAVRRQLKEYGLPREWEEAAIYTVCAGTMRAYAKDDLGEFARKLKDKLEAAPE